MTNMTRKVAIAAAFGGLMSLTAPAQAGTVFLNDIPLPQATPVYEIIPAVGAGLSPRERRELKAQQERRRTNALQRRSKKSKRN